MCVACRMYEFSRLQATHLRHHLQQQGIRCYVERHAEKGVGAALIELQREFAVGNIKLEQAVAGRQVHLLYVCHIPCADNHTARVRGVLYLVYHIRYLVDMAAVGCRPGAPLVSVDGTQLAILVCPLVPYSYPMLLKILHIGVALQEP